MVYNIGKCIIIVMKIIVIITVIITAVVVAMRNAVRCNVQHATLICRRSSAEAVIVNERQ